MSSHSLPSFAQAFSALDDRDRALPPIHPHSHAHSHSPYIRHDVRHEARHDSHGPPLPPFKRESRKRALERDDSSEPSSPRIVKQEQDVDQLDPSPPPQMQPQASAPSPAKPPRARQQLHLNTNVGIASSNANASNAGAAAATNSNTTNANAALPPPPPSLVRQHPPSKRRRVTISGVAHPNMHTSASYAVDPAHAHSHTPPPHTHTGPNTPISPVVMGFTIQRDPQAVEQVRAMLAVKQKQKALIESRRGSAAGLVGVEGGRRGSTAGFGGADSAGRRASVAAPSVTVNVVNPTPTTSTGPGPAPAAPPMRRTGSSPNGHRLAPTPPSMSPNARANAARTRSPSLLGGARVTSPSPHAVPSQSQSQSARATPLPPPPTSSSKLSPPSHHPHPQAHPHAGQGRPHMPSPPQPAPPSSSSNTQSQNQPPSFVASQGLAALAHNLPPPPNSFARRRAGQLGLRGNKPADLMISPRESESGPTPSSHKTSASAAQHPPQSQSHSQLPHRGMQMPFVPVSSTYKMLQPAIQSAPPRPGQQPGRFPMALPSLPPALGVAGGAAQRGTSVRKTSGQVPPTPTRLSLQRAQGTAESASVRLSQPTGLPRVPRTATAASFATPHGPAGGFAARSSMLMPGTPATLHRASGAGMGLDKAAFLAPFEQFFDALSDAQVLKGWFSEQLRRVGAVAKEGEAQVARLKAAGGESGFSKSEVEALVREAVQQETRTWRDEAARLHTQVTELQEVLRDLRSGEGRPFEPPSSSGTTSKGKAVSGVNGLSPRPLFQPTPPASGATTFPTAPGVDSYTFPPVQRPPTAPSSAPMHAPPPLSSATLMDASQRSVSPPRPRDTVSDSASGGGTGSGYGRSVSRSAASSPAPSLDGEVGRRLSVSAMRFEPQHPLPVRREAPTGEKEREKREGRPDPKRTNSHSGGGGATAGSGSKSNAGGGGGGGSDPKSDEHRNSITSGSSTSGAPKRSESPMDEN